MQRRGGRKGLPQLARKDFENLLPFRVRLRRFQHCSEDQAAAAVGLTHVQHQLLVAIKVIQARTRPPSAISQAACYCDPTAQGDW